MKDRRLEAEDAVASRSRLVRELREANRVLADEVERLRRLLDGAGRPAAGAPDDDDTLRMAMEVAQLGFWDQDFRTGSVRRSREWAQMLGYDPDDVEGRIDFWKGLVHPDDVPSLEQAIRDHESGRCKYFRVEHRLRTRDGRWKWILNFGRVVERDADGIPLRALGFHLDISERKRAEAELARADKLNSIGTLAGGLAHDFNNILTVILGNLSLALGLPDLSADAHRLLVSAERAALGSRELTERLLTFAAGGAPLLENVDVGAVLGEVVPLVQTGSRSICRTDVPPDLRPVAGNAGQINQLLHNLLLNANQAMPDGGTIGVRCHNRRIDAGEDPLLGAGDYVVIEVRDEGKGILPENLAKIFDPFFTTKIGGTGLGLSTVFSIARSHNGSVEAVPVTTEGACFRITLPAAAAAPAPAAEPRPACGSRRRILVVDDDDMVRELVGAQLERLGYEAHLAEDGERALGRYREALQDDRPFAAVIMDLTIPGGLGGKEAVRRLPAIDPDARVIVSSGYSNDPVMAQHRAHGFRGRLRKPYQIEDLARELAGVLRQDESSAEA